MRLLRANQRRLRDPSAAHKDATLAKRFAAMVFNDSFKGAMSRVTEKAKDGVMTVNEKTKSEMKSKHPKAVPVSQSSTDLPNLHPVFYSEVAGELVKKRALDERSSKDITTRGHVMAQDGERLLLFSVYRSPGAAPRD